MVSEISDNDFDRIDLGFYGKIDEINSKATLPIEIRNSDFLLDIINRKTESPRCLKNEIKPMMSGCNRVEIVVGYEDTRGNKYDVKVSCEREKETENKDQEAKPDAPDNRDRDSERDK